MDSINRIQLKVQDRYKITCTYVIHGLFFSNGNQIDDEYIREF